MAHGDDVRVSLLHICAEDEARAVHSSIAFDHGACMIDKDEIRDLHLVEMHTHGIGTIKLWPLGITQGQVTGKPVVKALYGNGPAGRCQSFLAVQAFFGDRFELGLFREDQTVLFGLIERIAAAEIEYVTSPFEGALLGR